MKTKILLIALVVLLIAADLPPQMPSCFYGEVNTPGTIQAVVLGKVAAKTQTFTWNGQNVYAIKIPTDGIPDGTTVVFLLNGRLAGSSRVYQGSNQHLPLGYAMRLR